MNAYAEHSNIPAYLWPMVIAVNRAVQVANAAKAARASEGVQVAASIPTRDLLNHDKWAKVIKQEHDDISGLMGQGHSSE